MILFEEYDFEVILKLNMGPDHLSCIETGEEHTNLEDGLLDTKLSAVCVKMIRHHTLPNDKNCPGRLPHPAEGVSGTRDRLFGHCWASVQNGV